MWEGKKGFAFEKALLVLFGFMKLPEFFVSLMSLFLYKT